MAAHISVALVLARRGANCCFTLGCALAYSAGVLDDGLIGNMNRDRLRATVAPKVAGLKSLLALAGTSGWGLEFVVNFSSTSSLFGSVVYRSTARVSERDSIFLRESH